MNADIERKMLWIIRAATIFVNHSSVLNLVNSYFTGEKTYFPYARDFIDFHG